MFVMGLLFGQLPLLFAGIASGPISFSLVTFRSQNSWYQARRLWVYLGLGLVAVGYLSFFGGEGFGVATFYSITIFLGGNLLLLELNRRAARHPSKMGEVSFNVWETRGFAFSIYRLTDAGIVRTKVGIFIHPLILALVVIPMGILLGLGLLPAVSWVVIFLVFPILGGAIFSVLVLSISRRRIRLARLPLEQLRGLKESKWISWSAISSAKLRGLALLLGFEGEKHRTNVEGPSFEAVRDLLKAKLGERFDTR